MNMPVALFRSRAEAEPVKASLAEAAVHAEIRDEPAFGRFWFVSPRSGATSLEVPAEQFERAEQLLLDWEAGRGPFDGAIHCPECGSLRVEYPQYTRRTLLTNLALGVAAQVGLVEKDFYCQDCHYTWPKTGTKPSRSRSHVAPYYFLDGIEQTGLQAAPSKDGSPAAQKPNAA